MKNACSISRSSKKTGSKHFVRCATHALYDHPLISCPLPFRRQRLLLSIDEAERSSTGAFRRQSQVHMSSAYSRSQSFDSLETSSTLSSIHSHDSSRTSDPRTDLERYLDDIFVNDPAGSSVDVRYSRYEPPDRQETYTELLDSRVMVGPDFVLVANGANVWEGD